MVRSEDLSIQLGLSDLAEIESPALRPGDPVRRSIERFRKQVASRASARISDGFFRSISTAAKLHPLANPARHQVHVIRDVPYLADGNPDHTLDIYRPTVKKGPWPVVLYSHGGGFRVLSKDTHWVLALIFAKFGYLVFNISYRLAPKHPFPAAIEDACNAYKWVVDNAEAYGGDLSRLAIAGESAGGNLSAALTVATTFERPEPYAKLAFDTGVVPKATLPFCAILQVSNCKRFRERKKMPFFVDTVLNDVEASYLRGADPTDPTSVEMADPLVVVESDVQPARPLPPHFLPVGTKDPLLPDTRRYHAALEARGVPSEAHYYPGELHAFHAFVWRKPARQCWRATFAFLDKHLG